VTSRSSRPTRGRRLTAAALAAIAVLFAACSDQRMPQDTFDPQGPVARKLDNLITPVFIAAAVVFVLVEVLIVVFAIKYRRRSDDDSPVQVHGNARLELAWTIIPAAILFVVAIGTLTTIADINREPTGPTVVKVDVTGHQWWWEYHYPGEGITTANELHIPVHRPVAISLRSVDVMHNFWPPKLAGKIYAIPGRVNHMVVQADKPGVYYGQCAEFCGLSHANMRLRVVAHSADDYNRWVTANTAIPDTPTGTSDAASGATLFRQKGCASCHTVEGYAKGVVGPNLSHLEQRNVFAGALFELNDENLRTWLRNPPKEKPGSIMPNLNLTEDEITKLIAYLNTLK
jgi:cytochrome c oxidase subunit 2